MSEAREVRPFSIVQPHHKRNRQNDFSAYPVPANTPEPDPKDSSALESVEFSNSKTEEPMVKPAPGAAGTATQSPPKPNRQPPPIPQIPNQMSLDEIL